jgi:guanosine-3',5'-bis(diphosphate) 3'-pyrophosphohydrolase
MKAIRLIFYRILKPLFLQKKFMCIHPKGDVKMLPIGATALDFAFSVHTASGQQMYWCQGKP